MKELPSFGGHLRALFAFDPKRQVIVLLGGDIAPELSRIEKEVDVRLGRRFHPAASPPPSPAIRNGPRHAGARSGAHPHLRPTQPFPTLMPADR